MFDIFAKLLSSLASFLFPVFASYKALKTSDPAQLTPWLMYWVVLACGLLVESWLEWFLAWIPLYAYVRLLFVLYLVLPQTQGARVIYQEHVHPWLEENETAIEEFIASAHDRLKAAGITYLKRAIEVLKTNVFGLPPSEEPAGTATAPEPSTAGSYTQALLARFSLPSARWNGIPTTPPTSGNTTANDLYSLLSSTLAAATAAAATTTPAGHSKAVDVPCTSGSPGPDSIRTPTARMSFLVAQRERLNMILSALDREATQLESEEPASRDLRPSSMNLDVTSLAAQEQATAATRPPSGQSAVSAFSGLSKTRSEQDFEKLEAESGAEEDMDEVGSVRKRGTPAATASDSGSWMPWGWGTGTSATGKSSAVDNE